MRPTWMDGGTKTWGLVGDLDAVLASSAGVFANLVPSVPRLALWKIRRTTPLSGGGSMDSRL
jgi:hypothetical protein